MPGIRRVMRSATRSAKPGAVLVVSRSGEKSPISLPSSRATRVSSRPSGRKYMAFASSMTVGWVVPEPDGRLMYATS
jgi:hypothetical protein